VTKRTVNNELANVKNMFSRAFQIDEIIEKDPCKKVKKFKINKAHPKYVSRSEIEAIIALSFEYAKGRRVFIAYFNGSRDRYEARGGMWIKGG
jgi:site-specific recombinase XerD